MEGAPAENVGGVGPEARGTVADRLARAKIKNRCILEAFLTESWRNTGVYDG
jgi:hypothetical protein